MKKRIMLIAAVVAVVGLAAYAGFDQYTGKNYTTLLAPTSVGTSYNLDGSTNSAPSVTNSVSTGVDCVGLVGRGAVVFGLNPGGAGVLTAVLKTCATTNGTYATVTNDQSESSWAVTNTAAYKVIPVRPNAFSRYWRVVVTATSGCTNASASSVLVTE